MKNLKEHYSSFFDEESDNTQEEGLKELEDYLKGERQLYLSKYNEAMKKYKDLTNTDQNNNFIFILPYIKSILIYLRLSIHNVLPFIGILPLLITLGIINIDLSNYIPDFIYDILPKIKYEITWTGPMAVISYINILRKYIKIIKLTNSICVSKK